MRVMLDYEPDPTPKTKFQVGNWVHIRAAQDENTGKVGQIAKCFTGFVRPYYRVRIGDYDYLYPEEYLKFPEDEISSGRFSIGDRVEITGPASAPELTSDVFKGRKGTIVEVKPSGAHYRVKIDDLNSICTRQGVGLTPVSEEGKNHSRSLLWNMLLNEARRVLRNNVSPYAADEDEAPSLTIPRISDETTLTVGDLRALAREEKEDTR